MQIINRDGKKKREMRNLMRRGPVWYFKKMVAGKVKPVSLGTDDLALAKAKRDALERQAVNGELDKIKGVRGKAGTLQDIFTQYDAIGGLKYATMRANKISLLQVVRVATDSPSIEAADVKLDVLTKRLVRDYQDKMRVQAEAAAGTDEKLRRMARDRADRTSKSTFRQGSSIFCKRRQLVERYREHGIEVPECVLEFRSAGAVGKMTTKVYFPASDAVLKETFTRIEDLKESDPECYYLFWTTLATGCRRGEVADMKAEDLVELDGRLWVGAGLGKDGEQIQIPVIAWPLHASAKHTPEQVLRELLKERKSGNLFDGAKTERHDNMPDRLNGWLFRMGWKDEKKLHALRAYIGCKLFASNPRLAQLYLRHKSIATTETFYSHFLALHGALDFAPTLAIVQTVGQAAAA